MRWRKGRRRWKRSLIGICFLLPGFFGTVCFALAFCRTVVRSFQNALGTAFVGLENYRMVPWKYSVFQIAAGNTCGSRLCAFRC